MVTEAFISALRAFDSATVSTGIEGLGVRDRTDGYADLRLRRLVAQPQPMVGYAITMMVDSTTPGLMPDNSGFAELRAALSASAKPAVVVIQESGPSPERGCHMGDVVGTMLADSGVVGVVSGSGIRDLDGIRSTGLTAFALGTVVAHGVYTITAVGVDVEVAGLRVRPGDLLHGDGDGLVSVPSDSPEQLLELVDAVRAREVGRRSALRQDSTRPAPVEALTVADELEIRALVARYHDAVGRSDADAVAQTWASDAQWHLSHRSFRGRDAIVDFWKNTIMPPYDSKVFQVLGQGLVAAGPGGAVGRWTFLDIGQKTTDDQAHLEAGCYRDRYVREGGRWVFAERRYSLAYRNWIAPGDFHGFPPLEGVGSDEGIADVSRSASQIGHEETD